MDTAILVIELIGFVAFLHIALSLLETYRRLNASEVLLSTTAFFFLSISQLCASLSIIYSDIRVSTALYVATTTTAIAAFFIMIVQRYSNKTYLYMLLHLPMLIIAMPDLIAGVLSTCVALDATRYTKTFIAILSVSYYLRALSVFIGVELSPMILLIAELTRSISAVVLSVYSSLKVFKL